MPAAGALGGMVVPALLYLAFNLGGDGAAGWGIPMATDVAFALGVLALLGSRVPAELKVLLLGLAIVDDVGAIVVIAAFYSDGLDRRLARRGRRRPGARRAVERARVRYLPVYVVLGLAIWLATFESGVHATIAGVALGLLAPARPFLPEVDADRIADELSADQARHRRRGARHLLPAPGVDPGDRAAPGPAAPLDELPHRPAVRARQRRRRPLRRRASATPPPSPVTLGVVVGLVVGKLVGVAGAIALAVRLGGGRLPDGRHHRATSSAWPASPASGSPCRSSSPASPSSVRTSPTRPRSACSRPPSSPRAWGRSILGRGERRRRAEARPPAMARLHERCVNHRSNPVPRRAVRCYKGPMHPVEVALIHWPRDGDERERLAEAMLPRLLLVPDDVEPPVVR